MGDGGRKKKEEGEEPDQVVTFFPVCFSTMSLLRENSSCCGVLEHPPLGIVLLPSLDLHLYGHRFVINRLLPKRRQRRLRCVELKQDPVNLKLMQQNEPNLTSCSDWPRKKPLRKHQPVNTGRNIYMT